MDALKRIPSGLCIMAFVLSILWSHQTLAGHIGNCHSYVLYKLTGGKVEEVYVSSTKFTDWLKNNGYKSTKDTSNLEVGDVTICHTHSGYVEKDGITHLRGSPRFIRWEKGKKKGKIKVENGKPVRPIDNASPGKGEKSYSLIDTKLLSVDYPHYLKDELRVENVSNSEIYQIKWGFIRFGHTIDQFKGSLPELKGKEVIVWTKRPVPEKIRIVTPMKYVNVNEKIKLRAEARISGKYLWQDVTNQKDTKWQYMKQGKDWKNYSSEFMQNEAGTYDVRVEYKGVEDQVSIKVGVGLKALEVSPWHTVLNTGKWNKSGEARVGDEVFFAARALYDDGAEVMNPKGVKWEPGRSIKVKEAKVYRVTAKFKGMEGSYTLKGLPPEDIIQFVKTKYDVMEGNKTIDLMVERIGHGKGQVHVEYEVDRLMIASATPGKDFQLSAGRLDWGEKETGTKPIKVIIKDDSEKEEDEYFYVHIKDIKGPDVKYGKGIFAEVVIRDDDVRGLLELAVDKYSVAEDGKEVIIRVKRKRSIKGKASVYYELVDQTATAGKDYKRVSGKLEWRDGSKLSQEIKIPILDDNDPEGPETFRIVLKDPDGAKLGSKNICVLTIEDNEDAVKGTPVVGQKASFTPREYKVNEGVGKVTVTVKRIGGDKGTFSIDYHTQDAYAEMDRDYKSAKDTLTWGDGDTMDKTFDVEIIDDKEFEPRDETIHLQLLNPHNPESKVAMDEGVEATVIILDNDKAPTIDNPPPTPRAPACRYLDVTPKKSVARPSDSPITFRAIAHLDDNTTRDVTNDPRTIWKPGPENTFPVPPGILFTERVTIVATWQGCSGTAEVNALAPPISSADDVNAKVPKPPADAYTWYVFCESETGEVTYGEHLHPGIQIMAGSFPGQRTAEKWIRDNCPRARCTADGRCAQGPARGGKWCVICDRNSGEITFSDHKPDSLRFKVMAGGLLGEPEAREWLKRNCPSQLCTFEGTCATSPAIAPTGTDGWYVTCFLPAGKIEIGKKPIDIHNERIIKGPFQGEPNARWWVNKNCPSWRCDTSGRCLGWGFGDAGEGKAEPVEDKGFGDAGSGLTERADVNPDETPPDDGKLREVGQEQRGVEVSDESHSEISDEFASLDDPETAKAIKAMEEYQKKNPVLPWEKDIRKREQKAAKIRQKMMKEMAPVITTLIETGVKSVDGISRSKKDSYSGQKGDPSTKSHRITGPKDSRGESPEGRPVYEILECINIRGASFDWRTDEVSYHIYGPDIAHPKGYDKCVRVYGPDLLHNCKRKISDFQAFKRKMDAWRKQKPWKKSPSSKGSVSEGGLMGIEAGDTTVEGEDAINDFWPSRKE